MIIDQFCNANEGLQIEAFLNGTLVGQRTENGYTIICRQVEAFYVEYLMLRNRFVDMRAFSDPSLLKFYLDKMDVNT